MNNEQTQTHKIHHNPNLGKPPPSPLYYTLCLAMGLAPKCYFVPGLPSGSLEIPKVETSFECPNGSCDPILDIYIPRVSDDIINFSIQSVLTFKITL
jgi:hypothetical protein